MEATDILRRADRESGVHVNYRETTTWYDGSPMTDARCVNTDIYNKEENGKYYRKTVADDFIPKVDNIAKLRIFNAYFEGQEAILLGYNTPGDKDILRYRFTVINYSSYVDDGGSIIKTNYGTWVAQFNKQINVKDFGFIDDATTDNANAVTKLNAYLSANASAVESDRLKLIFPFSSNYYKSTVPLIIPAFVDLQMDGVFLYSGTPDVTAITIGSTGKVNAKTSLKINVRGETISWANNSYEGFRIINLQSSTKVEIVQTVGFTFGGTCIGSNNAGFVYNKITLGQLANNKTDLKLTNFGNGWINENLFEGGRFQRASSINPTSDKYGVVITSEDAIYTNNNNNNFYKPSFEYAYSGTGETIPVVIEHGVQNSFKDVRFESGEVPCAIKTLNASTDNVFEIGYLGVSSFNYQRLAQDLGLYPNTRTFSRKNGIRHTGNKYLVYNSDYLVKKLFSKNGTHVYMPDEMFVVTSGSASNSKNTTAGITINTDYITINASTGIGVRVDTSQNKRFIINKYIKTAGRAGRIMVRCYNAAGTILTNDKVYVRGEATAPPAYFASYGNVYRLGSDANTNWFIYLHDDVAYIDVLIAAGTNPCDLVSFSIEALDFPTSIIDPYNKKGWYSTDIPTTTAYETGTVVYSTAQTAGRLLGWIYNGTKWIDMVPDSFVKIDNIAALRNYIGTEGQVIELLGYYTPGDKPTVKYKYTLLNFGTLVDDDGAIIKTASGSWVAQFNKDSVDVRDYGIKIGDTNSTALWTKLNTYCVSNNKYIDLSISVILVFAANTNIYTANIKGRGVTLTLDGLVWFRTDNLTNVDISGFNVVVKNNYTTLISTNGSTNIFYNPSAVYNANRTVSYQDLTCTAEAPLYDGSNRLSGFIRDGGYNKGIYRNIVTTNVSNPIITNSSASSRNHLIQNITAYNFGTCVWAQGENQELDTINAYNTPTQATNWVNKNNPTTPRLVNGFDVVLASGNGLKMTNIYGENPIERVVYVQCSNVKANNISSLNGDGVKFVGLEYDNLCKNIYVENVKLEFDSTFALTFNVTCIQIYWVDNWEMTNVTVNNRNTTADILLNLYSFKRTAKNVRLSNVTMVGDRGVTGPLGEFTIHEAGYEAIIPYENIELNNIKGIKSRGRSSASFNHYYNSAPVFTLIKNLKIINCNVEYQKISENGDDSLYRFDRIDGLEARGNSSNVRGHWVAGFPNPAPSGAYSNIFIQEDNFKATNIETNITAMNQGLTLLPGSYINFEIVKGSNLKSVFKGTGLSHLEWKVTNNVSNAITATDRTFFVEAYTKANAYSSCNIISNVKTAVIGTVPTTLVTYADGNTTLSVRGDTFSGGYEFKAKIFI